jgi:predicted enzyme related to lactoylglutathione lyase
MVDKLAAATAWIVVSPEFDPLVTAHIEHAGGEVIGEAHHGDDWREALAWARARTDRGIAELRRLRRRLAELEAAQDSPLAWTMYSPPRQAAIRQVRVGAGELHRIAAFWAAATGGTVERAGVLGREVDWALAAQPGLQPELLVSSLEPPGRVTLTVQVDDLDAKLRWLADLGGTVLQHAAGAALVEDPEGNRALLVQRRPDPAGGP